MIYSDTNISYGCILHLYNKIQKTYTLKDMQTEVMFSTLLKFHNMGLLTFNKKTIIFNEETVDDIKKLDSNEKLIYNSIKNLSTEDKLSTIRLIDGFGDQYLFLRDRFVSIDSAIENDLITNGYYNSKKKRFLTISTFILILLNILTFAMFIIHSNFAFLIPFILFLLLLCLSSYELIPINLLSKKSYRYYKSLKAQSVLLTNFLKGEKTDFSTHDLENLAKIAITFGYYSDFVIALKKYKIKADENSFLPYLKYYSKFINGEDLMDEQESKIQEKLRGIPPTPIELFLAFRHEQMMSDFFDYHVIP